MPDELKWKKLARGEYEAITDRFDFYARSESNRWVLDYFDHNTGDNDKAYIDSIELDTLAEAKAEAELIASER